MESPRGPVFDILQETLENTAYRRVLRTGPLHQIVVMSLLPGEEIGMEVHPGTQQFIRIEKGAGVATVDGTTWEVKDDFVIDVFPGSMHNIKNTSSSSAVPMKLYTIYSPPHHSPGLVQLNKPPSTDAEVVALKLE